MTKDEVIRELNIRVDCMKDCISNLRTELKELQAEVDQQDEKIDELRGNKDCEMRLKIALEAKLKVAKDEINILKLAKNRRIMRAGSDISPEQQAKNLDANLTELGLNG